MSRSFWLRPGVGAGCRLAGRAVTIVAVVSACDVSHGVHHFAELPELPDPSCVRRVLEEMPEIDEIEYRQEEGSRPLTLTGLKRPEILHRFSYRWKRMASPGLTLSVDYANRVTSQHGLRAVNRLLPPETIEAVHDAADAVERALEVQCGISGLQAAVLRRGS